MPRRVLHGLPLALALQVGLAGARPAESTPATEQSKAALARSLFDQGMNAMRTGACDVAPVRDDAACAEAAAAFQRVVELSPESLGALRNLALIEVNRERLATGAALWRELAERAAATTNPKYAGWAERARAEAEELSPRVPRIQLELSSRRPDTLTIDGVPVPPEAATLELDPGDHVIEAEAAGARDFVRSFAIAAGETLLVKVDLSPVTSSPPKPPDEAVSQRRKNPGPLVLGGVGAGVTLLGLGFGYAALRKRQDACGSTDECDPDGLDRTLGLARAANGPIAAGGVLVAGAVVWSVALKRRRRTALTLELSPAPGARLTTSW